MKRYLVLEDGSYFTGVGFGAPVITTGEIVLNSGNGDYTATITDAANFGQIVAFTDPVIGNVGINQEDAQSLLPKIRGVVARNVTETPQSWHSQYSLSEYLKLYKIPGITGLDTMALSRLLLQKGPMKASFMDTADEHAFDQIRALVLPHDQVKQVSTKQPYASPNIGRDILVVDLGVRHALLRELSRRDCNLTIVPYNTPAADILAFAPAAVVFTSGPGDPNDAAVVAETIQGLQGHVPILGIGLGAELIALANHAQVALTLTNHRGGPFPVREVATSRIWQTMQNHSYGIVPESLAATPLIVTHEDLRDHSVAGIRHRQYPVAGVLFYPEADPESTDATQLIDEFMEMVQAYQHRRGKEQTTDA
ncbi:carbamoyl phosphate synthase small subunit [Schleiferilactobacillus perolens]|jgi:carbamoyl-phosphate synthase small subunit|uniref:carbamoyl phosphate synthase small subunit n=1 Tax=Schleiferilactobacillus perolens TaxID=100468 RepID=UPI0023525FEC|nr:carbamoyl phosphate synthase small subunit [Schleiferilactobacillus perolens]MCI2171906.1 carbamoyl phosphate synthase small subunit [Schleiferilactobacillus perolens]